MTKEEATECLEYQNDLFFGGQSEALNMATEALKNESRLESLNERYKHIPLAEDIYNARAIGIERYNELCEGKAKHD